MKPAFVSLALPLLFLSPREGPQPTRLVVTGRVTQAGTATPLQAANVRITATRFSVGTDEQGVYRIMLPDSFRLKNVTIDVRAIGFKPASRAVKLERDTTTADFALDVEVNRLGEVVVTGVGSTTQLKRLGFTIGGPASVVAAQGLPGRYRKPDNTESYDRIVDNPFLGVRDNPLSTFSVDVDRASYSNVRRFVSEGQRPPKDAVRIEELVNYFTYEYPDPDDRHPFSVTTEVARTPWHGEHLLVRIGLQARRVSLADMPRNNLVFLVDVSGSMSSPDKLPLVKRALQLLVQQLREQDRVAMVAYAGAAGLVLPPTSGVHKGVILAAIEALESGGSTAGGAGIRLAYDVARQYHLPNGNNRVILATDGDFNVGASSDAEMERLIEEKRRQGTFLSVLGFGRGNLKDSKMEALADKGNGNYAYIDDIAEAKKVFGAEMGGTLLTLAKDVKLQVEFNPERVASYRLIGYENRLLRQEDFDDDTKDAGEIGAGHSVTALYEVVPKGSPSVAPAVEPLRYQEVAERTPNRANGAELMYIKLRYKLPDASTSRWLDHVVPASRPANGSADLRFAASVAAFGMILRESEYRGSASLDDVLALARGALGEDEGGYRKEFVKLVEQVKVQSLVAAKER